MNTAQKDIEPFGYIYRLTNTINGKVYIGQTTTSVKNRWGGHRSTAKSKPTKYDTLICRAIRKYGEDVWKVEAIETARNRDDLDLKEEILIKSHDSTTQSKGYNILKGRYDVSENSKNRDTYKAIRASRIKYYNQYHDDLEHMLQEHWHKDFAHVLAHEGWLLNELYDGERDSNWQRVSAPLIAYQMTGENTYTFLH